MSLALSNEQAGNAFFLPAHMLSLCKSKNDFERQVLILSRWILYKRSMCTKTHHTILGEGGAANQMEDKEAY